MPIYSSLALSYLLIEMQRGDRPGGRRGRSEEVLVGGVLRRDSEPLVVAVVAVAVLELAAVALLVQQEVLKYKFQSVWGQSGGTGVSIGVE